METCNLFFIAFGGVLLSELLILLNIHRVIKVPEQETLRPGGEVKPRLNRLQIIRLAMAGSIVMILVVFYFLLSQEGCIG